MLEPVLILLGGMLGAGHCLGMCGGFVLTLGASASSARANLCRQLVYSSGRIAVYALAGAFVGYGAWRLNAGLGTVINIQASLSILAGVLLIAEGSFSAGLLRRPFAGVQACPGASTFAALLRAPGWSAIFVAGCVNALLPCGLVYAYLALAAGSGNLFSGAAVMALFGLGTVPALLIVGLAGTAVPVRWRQRVFHAAAWCMLLTGVLSISRGVAAFTSEDEPPPNCHPASTTG